MQDTTAIKIKSNIRSPEELRSKVQEWGKKLAFIDQHRNNKRVELRAQIKILYWALGEIDDKDLQ